MIVDVVKVILPSVLAFLVGIAITPYTSELLYKHKMWKKKAKQFAVDGHGSPIFDSTLDKERLTQTPRLGGLIIFISATTVGFIIWLIARIFEIDLLDKIEFISRNQTWIPFATFIVGGTVGFIDDILEVRGNGKHIAGGLPLFIRLGVVVTAGLLISSWFFLKLDISTLTLPFFGEVIVGWLIIPIYTIIIMAIYAGGVIDGIDGLAGGVFAIMLTAYAVIAFDLNQVNLAAFIMLIVGSILAFLWFNVPPAKFYMSETGSMALTMTLAVIAFMTDSLGGGSGLSVLPIIALPLLVTVASVIIQVLSKKLRNGKKVFLVAPLHHHFEAKGWPPYKVTMRYWIFTVICSATGVIIALL